MWISKKEYEKMQKDIFNLKVKLGVLCATITQELRVTDPKIKEIAEERLIRMAEIYPRLDKKI